MFASLRSRIVFILIAAVVPAAVLVGVFAYRSFEAARSTQIASLGRDADALLASVDEVARDAGRLAVTLASFEARGSSICGPEGASILGLYPSIGSIALVRAGIPDCLHGRPGAVPVGEIAKALDHLSPASIRTAALSGGIVAVAASAPVPGRDATLLVVLDGAHLARLLDAFHSMPSSTAGLAEPSGRMVIAPRSALAPGLWSVGAPVLDAAPRIVSADSANGEATVYTAAKLPSLDLWLLTAQREADVLGWPARQLVITALAPMIILTAALLAIWIGLQSSVLRWVSKLRNATRAYSAGALTSRVTGADAAPREFSELATAFNTLADKMAERTVDLEREVASKTSYIREIHHRVKNNLQVIGSLLALQKRELPADQRMILRFPEDRINAMSAAYRASYAVSEIGHVPIGNVVREVVHRLQASGEGRHIVFDLNLTGGDMEIDLDTAISIAMLMAEILPAYTDGADRTGVPVELGLSATAETLRIVVRGSPSAERQSLHLGRRFIQAYLRQLNATMDEATEGTTVVEAPFPTAIRR